MIHTDSPSFGNGVEEGRAVGGRGEVVAGDVGEEVGRDVFVGGTVVPKYSATTSARS